MLTDLTAKFVGNRELAACAAFHRMACKANIKLPYEKFVEYAVTPYGDKLVSHDDAFFMDHDYNISGEEGTGVVSALKKLWTHMSVDERQRVHDYLDLLLAVHDSLKGA